MNDELIRKCMLFKGMSDQEMAACLSDLNASERSFKKGSAILHAGDVTDRMGIVLTGSVTIESNDIWGNCTILSHVGPGQVFAETYALLPGEVLLVDVMANEDCRIMFAQVSRLIGGIPEADVPLSDASSADLSGVSWPVKLYRNLLLISAHKNLTLSGRSFHTAPKSARGRLLSYLNSVSLKKRSTEFDIPFNRQQLADYLNLERTNMSKELTKMKDDGILECRKSHFKLL